MVSGSQVRKGAAHYARMHNNSRPMMENKLDTYKSFWPYYLREHSKPTTRGLHYVGTLLGIILLIYGLVFEPWCLLAAPFASYSFAWFSHFFVEKNHPTTLKYPLWSLLSDLKMFSLFIVGRLGTELKKASTR